MTFEQIKASVFGVDRVEEKNGKVYLHRFTREQEEMYKKKNPDFYMKTSATAGVFLEFDTDSENLSLSVEISEGSSRYFFTHSIYVNDSRIGELSGNIEKGESSVPFNKSFELGSGLKRIKIYFPWSVCSVITELKLDEGSIVNPIKKKCKILVFGDSITHGYDAMSPENSYASIIARKFDAYAINKGIGAEIFCPELADLPDGFSPDIITVAYGTNDWDGSTRETFELNSRTFFENLSKNYPNAKIFALAPIWRVNTDDKKDVGTFDSIFKFSCEIAVGIENMTVINCIDFIPHSADYLADRYVHPNDEGFKYYADNLWKEIKKYLQVIYLSL